MQGMRRLGVGLVTGVAVVAAVAATAVAAPEHQQQDQKNGHRKEHSADRDVDRLKVMSLNAWVGGTWVKGSLRKQIAVLKKYRPDVVGLQETRGHSAKDLAKKLGWSSYQSGSDLGVVSRYPITRLSGATSAGTGVQIRLPGGQPVELWTAHLNYRPYGPYDACYDNMPFTRLAQREVQSGRVGQTKELLEKLQPKVAAADAIPVLLVGDFNSPSHKDWTALNRARHCNRGPVMWPITKLIEDAGFKDSFREAHPDPRQAPGNTWSPVYPRHQGSTGAPEPQDRIDYIHYAGSKLRVRASRTVMEGKPAAVPHHKNNVWPSDHRAVLTTFSVD